MATTFHILGESYVDYICIADRLPGIGEDATLRKPMTALAGGSPLNTATHLQSLVHDNINICVQTVFNPHDSMGEMVSQHAEAHQLRIINDWTEGTNDTSTPHCIVLVTGTERSFLTHRGCAKDWKLSTIPRNCTYLHIAGYYCTPEFATSLPPLLAKARASGTIISLVTQYDVTQTWDGGLVDAIIPLLDILIMNQVEATSVMEASRGRKDGEILEQWLNFYNQKDVLFVITMGEKGAVAVRNQTVVSRIEPAATNVVDTTGAGDAFAAGFLYGHSLTNGGIEQALQWGCAVGSASVSVVGASVPVERTLIQQHLANLRPFSG